MPEIVQISPIEGLEALSLAGKGAVAAEALPIIDEQVSEMRKTVFRRAFAAIAAGTMTPEQAVNWWMELYAYHRLLKRFESVIRVGESAGARSPAATPPTNEV